MFAMNLADPELELIDPTPNVHALFLQFDKTFFYTKLASRAVVRWSKRMYSCAGICSYDRGGLCDIALSEPLLKLRPRKDLVETLLHEMIHAFLFITCKDQDRDGHGPNFKAHMYRINKAAGLNISIYHDFHDEVKLYQTHWWRCNGPCQSKRPHFGIVRRSSNRAPGPNDYWWRDHQRQCGGTFVKIKEPENKRKKVDKPAADITKYINNNNKTNKNTNIVDKPILKDSNINKVKSNNTALVVKKNNVIFNPQITKTVPVPSQITSASEVNDTNVLEKVRNIWANKQLPPTISASQPKSVPKRNSQTQTDTNTNAIKSPPKKIKKIDDYFKSNATNVLKDIYGEDFSFTQSKKDEKLIAVKNIKPDKAKSQVNCPICNKHVNSDEINGHLDECLSKEVIKELSQDNDKNNTAVISSISSKDSYKDDLKKIDVKVENNNCIDLTNIWIKPVTKEYPMTKIEINVKSDDFINFKKPEIKSEVKLEIPSISIKKETKDINPNCSKAVVGNLKSEQTCPCCGDDVNKTMEEHLDECLAFFDNNTTIPEEGASTSFSDTIEIDDDLDETLTFNETGTKSPCPCCMRMVEMSEMNDHLDVCLVSSS